MNILVKETFFLLFLFILIKSTEVNGQCNANFTNTTNLCSGDSILFSFTGTGASVVWNFGDTFSGVYNSDTNRIIKYRFTDTGLYTITLIANGASCTDTFKKTIRIVPKLIANFTWQNPCIKQATTFINTTIKGFTDAFTSYNWQFGDSSSSAIQHPNHTYQSFGNKTVKLVINSIQGCKDSISKTINIKPPLNYSASVDSVCQFTKANFTSTYGTSIPISWQWDFGDGSSSNTAEPEYSYSNGGKYRFILTATYSDSSTCKAAYDSIWVMILPIASFSILTDSIQCYKGNQTCIKFNKNPKAVAYRNILWDDGGTSSPNASDSQYCKTYQNTDGGLYRITNEIIDINGCANRQKDSNYIRVLKDPKALLNSNYSGGCFKTFLNAQNISNMSPPLIRRFIWDFGDGSYDSTNWTSTSHTYISDGNFKVKLFIEDTFGCIDLFSDTNTIRNINFIIDPKVERLKKCRIDNLFKFTQTPIPSGSITWFFGDGGTLNTFTSFKHYGSLGSYLPTVRLSKLGCDSVLRLDTAIVHGPHANANITNRYQCQIQDTVYFTNTTATYRNKTLQTKWNLFDPFASDCIIDTKNGQNIDSNCNNSIDSLTFKHWFLPSRERCYSVRIIQTDTAVGCIDSIDFSIPLMPPKADSGMFLSYLNFPCIGPEQSKEVYLNFGATSPNCGREAWQVMWDSTCARKSGNFNSFWTPNQNRHNYSYNNMPCDSNGYVTVGLIIQNGRDTNGQVCYDTGFYHKIIRFGPLSPIIMSNYSPNVHYCKNTEFKFSFRDSLQDSLALIVWDYGDNSKKDTLLSLSSQFHKYPNPGQYTVTTYLRHINGCEGNDSYRVQVGINKLFLFPKNQMCLGDSVKIDNVSRYWQMNTSHFANPARESDGKETTRWDIGDGNGFSKSGRSIFVKYNKIGDYTIKMETKDSIGCLDTLILPLKARVFGIKSKISTPLDTLICAQVVQLFSTSYVFDSINNFGHTDDSVVRFVWTFSDNSGASLQKNPTKFFTKGSQVAKLVAQNTRGCKDSVESSIFIRTPIANFTVVSDTSGCQPFLARFKNFSQNANNYKWLYKNAANITFTTNSIADVSFSYAQFGTFYPQLVAIRNAINNGIPISCSDTFPGPNTLGPKVLVNVLEKPLVRFTYTTNCKLYTTVFRNTTVISTDTATSYLWTFGDGDSSAIQNPTKIYADTGRYRVVLRIRVGKGCIDSFIQTVIISPQPKANFSFTEVCRGIGTQFTDLSQAFNDNIYIWAWNFGDGAVSNLKNPTRIYATDNNYRVFLRVTNRAGCIDTVTKFVNVFVNPTPIFSATNACKNNAVSFNNTSTAKNNSLFFTWTLGDGSRDSLKNPSKIYADTGNYIVKLVVRTINGCRDSMSRTVRTFTLPKANFSINNINQCFNGNQFNFTNLSTIAIDSISQNYWIASDGGSGFNRNYQSVFTTADSFFITLIAQTNRGCRDTVKKSVLVSVSPIAKISIDKQNQCIFKGPIQFTDTSLKKGDIAARQWNIGNLFTRTDSTFNYEFLTDGLKNIKLKVTHKNGCQDSAQTNITIYPKPKAVLLINKKEQCFNGHIFLFSDSSHIKSGSAITHKIYISTGDSSALGQFNYVFNNPDTFYIQNRVTSNFGCMDTANQAIIVHPHPIANFTIDTTQLCLRSNIFSFTNFSSIDGTKQGFNWHFNDNTIQADTHVKKSYLSYGIKPVKLKATSTFGCTDSITKNIVVFPMPIAKVHINDTAQCLNKQNFVFTDTSTIAYHLLNTKWVWNDLTTSNVKKVQKTFNQDTIYQHILISTSEKGCSDTINFTQRILPLPKPNFSINNPGQCVNTQNFVFSNLSISKQPITNYYWDFGDGNTSQNNAPSHQYALAGQYSVQLIAKTDRNCFDTIYKPLEVYPKPKAILQVNNAEQCFNDQNFIFTSANTISTGSIINYQWDTANQPFMGKKDTMLKFPIPGRYTIEHIPISNNGCMDTVFLPIILNPNPIANFSINDTQQCANANNFIFQQMATISYGSNSYQWFLNNQLTSQTASFSIIFSKSDTQLSKLVVSSARGCRDSLTKKIYISPIPLPDFSINNAKQCLNVNQFEFNNTSIIEDGAMSYLWNLGDLSMDSTKDVIHSYAQHGGYTINLKATSNWGCIKEMSKTINVHPEPKADFTVNDPGQCLTGNAFVTNNTSSIDSTLVSYYWDWDDGTYSSLQNLAHSYLKDSNYQVKLRVSSQYNCKDSVVKQISVNPMPVPVMSINLKDQCINTQNYIFNNNSVIKKGIIVNYQWQIEGNVFSNINNANYYFNASGPRSIGLLNWSDSGCFASTTENVRIWPKPLAIITVNDSVQCFNINNFIFTNTSFDSFGLKNTIWRTLGAISGIKDSLHKQYKSFGNKSMSMIATSINNCSDTNAISVRVKPMPNPKFELLKNYYCENNVPSFLIPEQAGGIFIGKHISNQQYVPRALWKDTVSYKIVQEGCIDSSSQFTDVFPLPRAFLGNDTTICKHETVLLKPISWNSTFVWQNGSTEPTFRAIKPGVYSITAANICGEAKASIEIKIRANNCRLYIPTAFSPNRNGLNDFYRPITFGIDNLTYEIFTRWGEKIFEGNNIEKGWDGSYMGAVSPEGWYVIVLKYDYYTENRIVKETANEVFYLLR